MTLSLQEVLIVGSCSEQVKFSELTLDMFRMLQSLEREPQEDMVQMYDASPAPGRIPYVSPVSGPLRSTTYSRLFFGQSFGPLQSPETPVNRVFGFQIEFFEFSGA